MATNHPQLTVSKIFFTLIYLLVFPALIFTLSGDWFWLEGWIFGVWFIVLCLTVIIYLYRHDPALLAERYKTVGSGNQKIWDRYVVFGLLIGFIAWIVMMPLDARRYGWSPYFPVWLKACGVVGLILSFFFFFRSFTDNTFISPLVRIQNDRKQHVVSTGVYGFVRHPMYLGSILLFIGAPLLMGSFYGLVIGLLITLLLMGRIIGEEKMLVNELDGYAEYRRKVKYRLIPGVW